MNQLFHLIGGAVCHQKPERSFFIGGDFLPVCARCTGMHTALFMTLIFLLVMKRTSGNKPPDLFTTVAVAFGYFPLAADGITSYLGLRHTNNDIRYITGVLFTFGLPILYFLLLNYKASQENQAQIIRNPFETIVLLLLNIGVMALLNIDHFVVWLFFSVATSVSVLSLFYALVFIVLKHAAPRLKKAYAIALPALGAVAIMVLLSRLNRLL